MYYDTLNIEHKNCPPTCNLCVEVCRGRSEEHGDAVIQKIDLPEENFHGVLLCNQCSQPECGQICPSGAISRSPAGVATIDREVCIGCGLCTLVCPYGGIYLNFAQKRPANATFAAEIRSAPKFVPMEF